MSTKMSINANTCFYLFKAPDIKQQIFEGMNEPFDVTEILNLFMDYLPIYTCINFVTAYPKYNHYYQSSNSIKKLLEIQKNMTSKEYQSYFKKSKISITKDSENLKGNILDIMIKHYSKTSDAIKRDKFRYGEKYEDQLNDGDAEDEEFEMPEFEEDGDSLTHWVQFNKTDIYNLHQLFKVFIGVAMMDVTEKRISSQTVDVYLNDAINNILDGISWIDMVNYKQLNAKEAQKKLEVIMIMYLLLRLILCLDGDKKIIYSANYVYEWWPGSMYEAAPDLFRGCTLLFEEGEINMISFQVDDAINLL